MTRRILILCALSTLMAFAMQAQLKQYSLEIGDFNDFTVVHDIDVVYKCSDDSAGYARFCCSPKVASAITFTNNKNKIKIEVISDDQLTEALPTVTIYSSSLSKVANHSASTVTLESLKPADKLTLRVLGNGFVVAHDVDVKKLSASSEAGSGHVCAQGKCDEASYTVAGAGAIECGSVVASKVKVSMAGTGSVDCTANAHLNVYGLGSGSVYYAGSPQIRKRALGVKLVPMDKPSKN